jgi:hypothetical protein
MTTAVLEASNCSLQVCDLCHIRLVSSYHLQKEELTNCSSCWVCLLLLLAAHLQSVAVPE